MRFWDWFNDTRFVCGKDAQTKIVTNDLRALATFLDGMAVQARDGMAKGDVPVADHVLLDATAILCREVAELRQALRESVP